MADKKNIVKIRETYAQTGRNNVGPTSDNSSRIAMLKQIQVRLGYGANKTAQFWGLNTYDKDGNADGNKNGVSGDSSVRTYFRGIFPRMSF